MADLDQILHSLNQYATQHAEQPRQLNAALVRIQKTLKRIAPPHGAFSDLPQEIMVHIFQYLDFGQDCLRARSVCTLFRQVMETTAQCRFQECYGPTKANNLTWVQSVFQARRLARDHPTLCQYRTPTWLSQGFKCGMTLHTLKDLQFVPKVEWRELLPHLYCQGLGNVADLFWPLASDNMLSFIDGVCAIWAILDYKQNKQHLRECLDHLERFLYDMLAKFQPTWVANTSDRTHLKSVHLGLPSLYDITQITLGTHHCVKPFPKQCKSIGTMWNTILHKLKAVDPTFFSLVMWSNVPKDTGQLLAQHLPGTFFLEAFFPGNTKVGFDDLENNLPKIFFSQPYRVPGDAGILNCVYKGNYGFVSPHWKSTLSSPYYVIHDTPLCHHEIMDIVCRLGDLDLLTIAIELGVNKRALHPDTDAVHDSPLLTYLKRATKNRRAHDIGTKLPIAKITTFVAVLIEGGYPCLVRTPKAWRRVCAQTANSEAWHDFKKHNIPRAILDELAVLLSTNISGLVCD